MQMMMVLFLAMIISKCLVNDNEHFYDNVMKQTTWWENNNVCEISYKVNEANDMLSFCWSDTSPATIQLNTLQYSSISASNINNIYQHETFPFHFPEDKMWDDIYPDFS